MSNITALAAEKSVVVHHYRLLIYSLGGRKKDGLVMR